MIHLSMTHCFAFYASFCISLSHASERPAAKLPARSGAEKKRQEEEGGKSARHLLFCFFVVVFLQIPTFFRAPDILVLDYSLT